MKSTENSTENWGWGKTAIFLLSCLVICFGPFIAMANVNIPLIGGIDHIVRYWLVYGILFVFICVIAGLGFTNDPRGLLIDRRNMLSLSKLQMVMWTGLVIVTFVAIADQKISNGVPAPLDIGVPDTLWVLMGISITALIGSPIIKNTNYVSVSDDPTQIARLKKLQEDLTSYQTTDGTEVTNRKPEQAKFADLFRGEEVGNYKLPDLGKIQLFLFTLIVWATYAALIYQMLNRDVPGLLHSLANENGITVKQLLETNNQTLMQQMSDKFSFPALSGGMDTLIAISTGGYLGYKAVNRGNLPEDKTGEKPAATDIGEAGESLPVDTK